MAYLRSTGIKPRTLKTYIGNLKIYFDYLVFENYREQNIIKDIHIKGIPKTIISDYLEPEELEDLYYSYNEKQSALLSKKRNKVMLGLLVYQGLNTRDLHLLQVEHLQLYKGKITVPGTAKSNSRDLELKPWQLMEFMEYVNEVRPQILNHRNKLSPIGGDAEGRGGEQLLLPIGTSFKLHNTLHKLTAELKEINHKVTSLKQLRTSVIIHWLKQHQLRKTQYLAGHKYISSTERYIQDDLESLHETVNNFHPFS